MLDCMTAALLPRQHHFHIAVLCSSGASLYLLCCTLQCMGPFNLTSAPRFSHTQRWMCPRTHMLQKVWVQVGPHRAKYMHRMHCWLQLGSGSSIRRPLLLRRRPNGCHSSRWLHRRHCRRRRRSCCWWRCGHCHKGRSHLVPHLWQGGEQGRPSFASHVLQCRLTPLHITKKPPCFSKNMRHGVSFISSTGREVTAVQAGSGPGHAKGLQNALGSAAATSCQLATYPTSNGAHSPSASRSSTAHPEQTHSLASSPLKTHLPGQRQRAGIHVLLRTVINRRGRAIVQPRCPE